MIRLAYVLVGDGTELDRVTLGDDGQWVTYGTGAARDVIAGFAVMAGTESAAVELLAEGWSNGYVSLNPTTMTP